MKSIYGNYTITFNKIEKYLNKKVNPFIIIDYNVQNLYPNLKNKFTLTIDSNESSKEISNIKIYIEKLLSLGIKRNSTLIGIGGGVIQDITGFIASILFRGIDWEFCPTTLLSQCDSCIGSKSSININKYKNLIGTFYPPKNILIDIKFLDTLSKSDIESGFGEIIKYHILDGKTELISNDYKKLINYCLSVKKFYIEEDEFDKGIRRNLNYGHTFGHALESSTGFNVSHGLAVLIGIDISNYISRKLGYMSLDRYKDVSDFIRFYLKGKKIPYINSQFMIDYLHKDKKNVNNNLTFIGLSDEGIICMNLPYEDIKKLIEEYYENSVYDSS